MVAHAMAAVNGTCDRCKRTSTDVRRSGAVRRTMIARFFAPPLPMPLHPTRRRGETVRGLVYGVLAGALIWTLVLLIVVLLF